MQNYKCIESLRAYMAWWVVLSHALGLIGIYDTGNKILNLPIKLISWATMPVNIFIIVSGFVITHLFLGKREEYSAYLLRRFFRIFPIYLFCLFVAIAAGYLRYVAYIDVSFNPEKSFRLGIIDAQNNHFWTHFLLHITMLHGIISDSFLPYTTSTFLGPAWSLSLEWQFYVVAPLIIGLMASGIYPMVSTALILYLLSIVAKSGVIGTWNYPAFLFLSIQYFLIGIISRLMLEKFKEHKYLWEIPVVLALTFSVANTIETIIWLSFFLIVLVESGRIKNVYGAIKKLLDIFVLNNIVTNLGKWSYSTYLIHVPLFGIVVGGFAVLFGKEIISLKILIILMLSCIPIILAASWILYSTIEMGGIKLGKRVSNHFKQRRLPETALSDIQS